MKFDINLNFPSFLDFPAIRVEDLTGTGCSVTKQISESFHYFHQAYQRQVHEMKLKMIMALYHLSHAFDQSEFQWNACPRQWEGYLSDLWRQLGEIGKVIVVGWIMGLSLVTFIVVYDYATNVSLEQVPPPSTQFLVPSYHDIVPPDQETEREYVSPSSGRTTSTTSSSHTATSHSSINTTGTGDSNSNQTRLPEHLRILSYLYPNGSIWPAHYITACKNAEMTMSLKEDNLALVTYDTPCSSNTRRSKAETIRQLKGKITLSRSAVERDLREGLVGYREGVPGMGDWKGIRWID